MAWMSKKGLLASGIMLWMTLAEYVVASNIVPSDPAITQLQVEDGTVDVVSLLPANEHGISVNFFDTFQVDSRSLKLANVTHYVDNGSGEESVGPAELVVIIASDIDIQNAITMVGPASDIVFLTDSPTGSINCDGCSFNNFLRVSLLAAQGSNIDVESSELGELSSGLSSSVSLNDVYASGVIALDILGAQVSNLGVIDLNARAMLDARGGYTNIATGNLLVGTGLTNIIVGDHVWNYENQQLILVESYSGEHTLGGFIHSPEVKISVSGDFTLDTNIDTRTDLISSVSYKNGAHIPGEGIDVYSYSEGNIEANGNLISGGLIKLAANDDLVINSSSYIEANQVELIAVDKIENQSDVNGVDVALAGNQVINEGSLAADLLVEIWAKNEVMNQYGGHITADAVRLMSDASVVRNGSRTPYRSRDIEAVGILTLLQNSYVADLNASKLGTYYSLNHNPAEATGVSMPSKNTAHIDARQLEISAVGFENINPYYQRVAEDESLVYLSRDRLNQVRVSVEDSVVISASSYIVNSSAQLMQNSSTGMMAMHTALFANERYRIETILDYYSVSETDNEYDPLLTGQSGSLTTTDEILGTRTVAYSPPGSIVSMGYLENKSTQSFLNNAAYIEIFGNATVDTPYIKDFGFENHGVGRTTSSGLYTGIAFDQFATSTAFSQASQAVDPNELDSLFYVHGDFIANADYLENDGNALFTNHSPLDYFINQTIEMLIEENYSHIGNGAVIAQLNISHPDFPVTERTVTTVNSGGYAYSDQSDIDAAMSTNVLEIHYVDEKTRTTTQYDLTGGGAQTTTEEVIQHTGSDTFNLFDELKRYYDSIVDSISEFFEEVTWW